MKIYNTLTKKIDEFIPNEEGKVTMYTCGPTVYNYAHIGNLRTYISEDILQKALEYIDYDVNRCMNITDVGHLVSDGDEGEDKMAVASRREKKSALEIASFYTDAFMKDIEKLNIKKPAIISKATDNIDEYIKVIEKLINDGYAYVADGNVYFDTTKYKDYYKLSNRNPLEQQAAIRDDVEIDKAKKNVNDFGLWFTNSKFNDQELKWDSPWGVGYPGWHIECSCISLKYLGEKLDIHCGAVDAIFPHHTNEIAQSECFLGHKWCNYWVHMEFLNDKSGKMSKSKGEFLTLSLLEEKGYTPLEYRFFCLNSHYRNVLEFSYETMDSSKNAYHKLLNRIGSLKEEGTLDQEAISRYKDKFKEALENDLNTALAITTLYDVLKDGSISDATKLELIADFDKVLSLDLLKKDAEIDKDLEEYILKEIERRKEAKKNKDFALADQIRDELKTKGITLIDSREGTTYKVE